MTHDSPTRLRLGLAAASVAALCAGATFSTGAQEPERGAQPEARIRPQTKLVPQRQWEYKQLPCILTAPMMRERGDITDRLNEDGKHGWELVSLVELEQVPGRECLLATFKREVLN